MKRLFAILLVLVLCLSFTACDTKARDYEAAEALFAAEDYEAAAQAFTALGDYEDAADRVLECRYKLAEAVFEAEDFAGAAEAFEALGTYSDSAEMAGKCRREIGMRENADYSFLQDMEAKVREILDGSNMAPGTYEYYKFELERFEKYEEETFYDQRLHELAKTYIEGLKVSKSSVSASDPAVIQDRSMTGTQMRYQVMMALNDEFDFMADDPLYTAFQMPEQEAALRFFEGYSAIRQDMTTQLEAIHPVEFAQEVKDSGEFCLTITNNTEYSYTGYHLLTLKNVNGVVLAIESFDVEELQPGASSEIKIKLDEAKSYCEFDHFFYFMSIGGYASFGFNY